MPTSLEVLHKRLKQKQKNGRYNDNYKLCLAVEGGGIMGVVSCGMLMAMRDLELLDLFDSYVGSSSGSINLAYTLAGYPEEGLSIYYEHMVNHRMVDTFRVIRGGYAIDLRVLEKIVKKYIPSPIEILNKTHPADFHITVTSLRPVEGHLINVKDAGEHFFDYLIAGATIPYVSGKPKSIDRKKYCDGGFSYPDLRMAAHEMGATHVIVLSTQPKVGEVNRYDDFRGKSYKKLLSRNYRELRAYWDKHLEEAQHFSAKHPEEDSKKIKVHHLSIGSQGHEVDVFSRDKWIIIDGARRGYETVVRMFLKEATVGLVPEVL